MWRKERVSELIGFDIHDGSITDVSWRKDKLQFTILGCSTSKMNSPKITLCFHGVEWVRSVCDEMHDGYVKNTSFEEYPLIPRYELSADYVKFVSSGLLDNVTFLAENVVCFNDIFFFECTDVTVINKNYEA